MPLNRFSVKIAAIVGTMFVAVPVVAQKPDADAVETQPVIAQPLAVQQVAVLQGLNKITARVSTIEAPVDEAVRFGTLDITVKRCSKRPPEETPESTAYLEIRERRPGEQSVDLFAGWMFASSPAVSSMEHPVYDVWVIDCKKVSSSD